MSPEPTAIGDSVEHTAFHGTLSLEPELLLALWAEIGRGVTRTGLRKLVILNSHGGQVGFVDQAALRLRAEEHMLVIRANYFTFGTPERGRRSASTMSPSLVTSSAPLTAATPDGRS